MTNPTVTTLVGSGSEKNVVQLVTITGADVTAAVVYDNDLFVNNTAKGRLMGYSVSGSSCLLTLNWAQTTPFQAIAVNPQYNNNLNMKHFGGIGNPNGAGATGDLTVTTVGLGAGNSVTLILWIVQN